MQRLACVVITGAIGEMEAMLDRIPLHVQMKTEEAMDAIRLERNIVCKPRNIVSHLQILAPLGKLVRLTDHMTSMFHFDKQFELVIQDKKTGPICAVV